MGRVYFLIFCILAAPVSAATPPLAQNLFWSRPCAALLSSFYETLPPIGRKRQIADSTRATAEKTLLTFSQETFGDARAVIADGELLLDSHEFDSWWQPTVNNRVASFTEGIKDGDALVGVFDGSERIQEFLDSFHDKTIAMARAGEGPQRFAEKIRSSQLGQALLAGAAATAGAQIATGHHYSSIWLTVAAMAYAGLTSPFDFSWRLPWYRDGGNSEQARLPHLFSQSYRLVRGRPNAPRWVWWGSQVRLSLETFSKIWDDGPGGYVSRDLGEALDLDDQINTMPFLERWKCRIRAARLKRQHKDLEDSLQIQTGGPEALFDFALLQAGVAGLKYPRLIVGFRLPPNANEGDPDGDGNIPAEPPFHPTSPHSPQPVGMP